jgi:hypothetical protein
MGYLSPFLNEDLARLHSADLSARAELQRQVRAARTVRATRAPRAGRWKSGLGWALVNAGLGLISHTPESSRGRPSVLAKTRPGRRLSPLMAPDPGPRGCDG